MLLDSDIALFGTGIAPLIAARFFLEQGKSVLILNPDLDFFLEESELPMDFFNGEDFYSLTDTPSSRLNESLPEFAISELAPIYPGALEYWNSERYPAMQNNPEKRSDFHDPKAPFVRSRQRMILEFHPERWERIDDFYLKAIDARLNPQIREGIQAYHRFPGSGAQLSTEEVQRFKGVSLPKLADVDVIRYRNGILEFLRERLDLDRILSNVSQVALMQGGLRFYFNGDPMTARLKEGLLVFWTPGLTNWISTQAKKLNVKPILPQGVRIMEEWSLQSPYALDPGIVGIISDKCAVWANFEGAPVQIETTLKSILSVLLTGPREDLGSDEDLLHKSQWVSKRSMLSLLEIFGKVLKWERIGIGGLLCRAVLEWEDSKIWYLSKQFPPVAVVPKSDGALVQIVKNVKAACKSFQIQPPG